MRAPTPRLVRRDRPMRAHGVVLYALGPRVAFFILALVIALVVGTVIVDRKGHRPPPPPAATVAVPEMPRPAAPAEPVPALATAPAQPVPAASGDRLTVLRETALHEEPAADSPVLARLDAGEAVELLAPTSVTGFFRVRRGDDAGWVWYHDINPGPPDSRQQRR